jgi:hypothetical protein
MSSTDPGVPGTPLSDRATGWFSPQVHVDRFVLRRTPVLLGRLPVVGRAVPVTPDVAGAQTRGGLVPLRRAFVRARRALVAELRPLGRHPGALDRHLGLLLRLAERVDVRGLPCGQPGEALGELTRPAAGRRGTFGRALTRVLGIHAGPLDAALQCCVT